MLLALADNAAMHRVIEECVAAKSRMNLRPNYVAELRRFLLKFSAIGKGIGEVTVADLESWLETTASPGSRNTAISRLGALFSFAHKRGYIEANPMRRIERARIDRRPPKILTPLEAGHLMDTTRARVPRMLAYCTLGLYAGIRPNELTKLDWSCVDLARGMVRVDAAASKVRRRRIVFLEPIALRWLGECAPKSGPVAPEARRVRGYRERLCRLMGWEEWSHDLLRHCAASYLLALHRDAGKVAMMLGNSPSILLTHYYELVSPEDCARFWSLTAAEPRWSWPPA